MNREMKFYKCPICGNLVGLIKSGGGELVCCGKPMQLLEPNTVDAAHEKHVPVIETVDGGVLVKVGSVEHPMIPEHYIEWICVVTDKLTQRYMLEPGEKPQAFFALEENTPVRVYAYCNLHGLWSSEG